MADPESNSRSSEPAAVSRAWAADAVGRLRAAARWLEGLPELAQVAIWSGLILAIILVPFLLFLFRTEIWWTFRAVLAAALSAGVVAGVRMAVTTVHRRKRERMEAARRTALEERLARQRARAERLRRVLEDPLPALPHPGELVVHEGESPWFACPASLLDAKGQRVSGNLYVTSRRIVFASLKFPLEIPGNQVLALNHLSGTLQVIGKTAGTTQMFSVDDAELVGTYVLRAARTHAPGLTLQAPSATEELADAQE